MGALEHASTGVRHPLASRMLVGRSQYCPLRLSSQQASGVHAEIAWDGERWFVHDLGSRNGTHLDGRKLTPDQREPLALGSEVVFGTSGERFVLVDASPPTLLAMSTEGHVLHATDGLLCLPSEDDPQVTLLEQLDGTWQLETEQGVQPLDFESPLSIGGTLWRIDPPGAVQLTDDGGDTPPISVGNVRLELTVSRDEEHVALRVHHGTRSIALRPRAHDFFLLTLARARLADQQQPHLEPAEHGWVYRQDLARSLKVDRNLLNLWIYRARRQFTDAGVLGVATLIERRLGAEQLRLGIAQLLVSEA